MAGSCLSPRMGCGRKGQSAYVPARDQLSFPRRCCFRLAARGREMNLQIKASLSQSCVAFLSQKLQPLDTTKLEYFRLYDRTHQTATAGVRGRCTYPTRKMGLGYRVRCCVSIMAGELPYPAKWATGTRRIDETRWEWIWREDWFHTKEEAFVWIAG